MCLICNGPLNEISLTLLCETMTYFISILEIYGKWAKGLQNYQLLKLEVSRKNLPSGPGPNRTSWPGFDSDLSTQTATAPEICITMSLFMSVCPCVWCLFVTFQHFTMLTSVSLMHCLIENIPTKWRLPSWILNPRCYTWKWLSSRIEITNVT